MIDSGGPVPEGGWLAPSPRLRVLRRLEVGVGAAVVLGAALAIEAVAAAGTRTLVASAVIVVVLGLAAGVLLARRVQTWGYAEREDDLMVRRGLLVRRLSVIPYGRMQFVDVTAGPLERAFGLATVRMHTAAAATDARIPGLVGSEATRLRDRLTALGEARVAGL